MFANDTYSVQNNVWNISCFTYLWYEFIFIFTQLCNSRSSLFNKLMVLNSITFWKTTCMVNCKLIVNKCRRCKSIMVRFVNNENVWVEDILFMELKKFLFFWDLREMRMLRIKVANHLWIKVNKVIAFMWLITPVKKFQWFWAVLERLKG